MELQSQIVEKLKLYLKNNGIDINRFEEIDTEIVVCDEARCFGYHRLVYDSGICAYLPFIMTRNNINSAFEFDVIIDEDGDIYPFDIEELKTATNILEYITNHLKEEIEKSKEISSITITDKPITIKQASYEALIKEAKYKIAENRSKSKCIRIEREIGRAYLRGEKAEVLKQLVKRYIDNGCPSLMDIRVKKKAYEDLFLNKVASISTFDELYSFIGQLIINGHEEKAEVLKYAYEQVLEEIKKNENFVLNKKANFLAGLAIGGLLAGAITLFAHHAGLFENFGEKAKKFLKGLFGEEGKEETEEEKEARKEREEKVKKAKSNAEFYKSIVDINKKIQAEKDVSAIKVIGFYNKIKEKGEKGYKELLEEYKDDKKNKEIIETLYKLKDHEHFDKIRDFIGAEGNNKLKEHAWNEFSKHIEETGEHSLLNELTKHGIFSKDELKEKLQEKSEEILKKEKLEENDLNWLKAFKANNIKKDGKDIAEHYADKIISKGQNATEEDLHVLHGLITKGGIDISRQRDKWRKFVGNLKEETLSNMDFDKFKELTFHFQKHGILDIKNKEHRKKILDATMNYLSKGDTDLKEKVLDFMGDLGHMGLKLYHIKDYRDKIEKHIKEDGQLWEKYRTYFPRRVVGTFKSTMQRIGESLGWIGKTVGKIFNI